jgi:hypothetical protein
MPSENIMAVLLVGIRANKCKMEFSGVPIWPVNP